jgi:hypothetical protein
MHDRCSTRFWLLRSIAVPVLLASTLCAAQLQPAAHPAAPARPAALARPATSEFAANAPASTDKEVAATQAELLKLLRVSPTLTTVVAHDPSLLSNQDYVARNNPQLAEFLTAHPEVARNPEYYLFNHLQADGGPDVALERAVWPNLAALRRESTNISDITGPIAGVLAFACFLFTLIWIIRVILENRRWGRIFKLQSEVHGRLIDKFSSNQELALYMETEAGKRFLEAAPIPVNFEPGKTVPNAVARVLTPLQIGIVMALLGVGLLFLSGHTGHVAEVPLLVFATVVLMPGIGFIISAGITWILAARLGLIPEKSVAPDTFDPTPSSKERQ